MAKPEQRVWALTFEVNAHDQHGEYLVCLFKDKPSIKELAEAFYSCDTGGSIPTEVMAAVSFLEHIREGGGRRGNEEAWYHLKQEVLR